MPLEVLGILRAYTKNTAGTCYDARVACCRIACSGHMVSVTALVYNKCLSLGVGNCSRLMSAAWTEPCRQYFMHCGEHSYETVSIDRIALAADIYVISESSWGHAGVHRIPQRHGDHCCDLKATYNWSIPALDAQCYFRRQGKVAISHWVCSSPTRKAWGR